MLFLTLIIQVRAAEAAGSIGVLGYKLSKRECVLSTMSVLDDTEEANIWTE